MRKKKYRENECASYGYESEQEMIYSRSISINKRWDEKSIKIAIHCCLLLLFLYFIWYCCCYFHIDIFFSNGYDFFQSFLQSNRFCLEVFKGLKWTKGQY